MTLNHPGHFFFSTLCLGPVGYPRHPPQRPYSGYMLVLGEPYRNLMLPWYPIH